MKDYTEIHTFVICAYKESPYLEECVRSLLNQKGKSRIIMVTSTPNTRISEVAETYHIPLFINDGEKGITRDWNFAYSHTETPYVTIAHQDDLYLPDYTRLVIGGLRKAKRPLIVFTDYYELKKDVRDDSAKNLRIKKFLLFPLRNPRLSETRFFRRMSLAFGNSICCPSVTYVRQNLPDSVFTDGFFSNVDWEAWERLSREKGAFVYLARPLMCHRIHESSATSQIIGEHGRGKEDFMMFRKFWPSWTARILTRLYSASESGNELDA